MGGCQRVKVTTKNQSKASQTRSYHLLSIRQGNTENEEWRKAPEFYSYYCRTSKYFKEVDLVSLGTCYSALSSLPCASLSASLPFGTCKAVGARHCNAKALITKWYFKGERTWSVCCTGHVERGRDTRKPRKGLTFTSWSFVIPLAIGLAGQTSLANPGEAWLTLIPNTLIDSEAIRRLVEPIFWPPRITTHCDAICVPTHKTPVVLSGIVTEGKSFKG